MANEQAVLHGIEDANDWMIETPRSDWADAVKRGQLGADEGLINALGSGKVAEFFGVRNASDAFSEACGDYSKAWRDTVIAALAEIESVADDGKILIGEDGYPVIADNSPA